MNRSSTEMLHARRATELTPVAETCRFCWRGQPNAPWDVVLWATEHFVAVPSKGGFVPGWMLIVPRQHALSMLELPLEHERELQELVRTVASAITEVFGAPTAFEHGASAPNTTFGCGIDHAHLHLVPLPESLSLRTMAEAYLNTTFAPQSARPQQGYLRVREPRDADFLICEPGAAPRQFFRQLIWNAGEWGASTFEYDTEPCEGVVRATVAALGERCSPTSGG